MFFKVLLQRLDGSDELLELVVSHIESVVVLNWRTPPITRRRELSWYLQKDVDRRSRGLVCYRERSARCSTFVAATPRQDTTSEDDVQRFSARQKR